MTAITENLRPALVAAAILAACAEGPHEEEAHEHEGGGWPVTVWGERYEIFAEIEPLAAGEPSEAHVHVTVLDGFAPLDSGRVEVVLRGAGGEETFAAGPSRPGVFAVELAPRGAGEAELLFRVSGSAAGSEAVEGGRVRVGEGAPGSLLVAPAPRGATDGGEPLEFLKEEQWRSDFATAWVRRGALRQSLAGFARVRPPAGGEVWLSAPIDGVLGARPWPYPGQTVAAGEELLRLTPRVTSGRSLAELEADVAALEGELAAAQARRGRLEELLALEAVSRRELEEAELRATTAETRLAAARRDLASARALRRGTSAESVALRAPFAGRVAAVEATPGAAVGAGEALARLVRDDRLWLEVALVPEAARRLAAGAPAGLVVTPPESPPIELAAVDVRLVSIAPEIDAATGTVAALLELAGDGPGRRLALGATVEAEVLLEEEAEGIVVPATAVVDDGGVAVVYLQLAGERFARQPVEVVLRQGERLLVAGLVPGQRLVTRGGVAIRRSVLLASGGGHGHAH